jgi:molybdate transport system regulatory protein
MQIMTSPDLRLKVKIQIFCGTEIAMGPGKADLLDAIITQGSISAAGRVLGMSYRRAWLLVDTMNRCWDQPLVAAVAGGGKGGGAHVTQFGTEILRYYRELQQQTQRLEQGAAWQALQPVLRPEPRTAQRAD